MFLEFSVSYVIMSMVQFFFLVDAFISTLCFKAVKHEGNETVYMLFDMVKISCFD